MPSFDIVSEIDEVELRHAVENASRELTNRFDFRGGQLRFELDNHEQKSKLKPTSECQQMIDILRNNLVKRSVDTAALSVAEKAIHSGKTFTLICTFKQGIDQPFAKRL